jgi:hypothetical protein
MVALQEVDLVTQLAHHALLHQEVIALPVAEAVVQVQYLDLQEVAEVVVAEVVAVHQVVEDVDNLYSKTTNKNA